MSESEDQINIHDPEIMYVHMIHDHPDGGWVHTHGLAELGFTELEIRGIHPLFLMIPAAQMLNGVADQIVNGGKPFEVDHIIDLGGYLCQIKELDPLDDSHEGYWTLEPLVPPPCTCCSKKDAN